MTIRTDTWHYRFYSYWRRHAVWPPEQETLCHYFWAVVLFAPARWVERTAERLAPGWLPVVGRGLTMLLVATYLLSAAVFLGVIAYQYPLLLLMAVGAFLVALGGLIVLLLVWQVVVERKSLTVPSTFSLAWEYAKARKRKVCPLITFEVPTGE